jgi:hypothetical protein
MQSTLLQTDVLQPDASHSPAPTSATARRPERAGTLRKLAWCSIMALALYYVWRYAGYYLDVRPESYDYLWPKRAWLWLHLGGGTVAVLLGPFQSVGRLRSAFPHVHRWTGRCYLAGMLCAAIGAGALSVTTPLGWTTAYAFAVMIGAWVATAAMAWLAILKRQVAIHRDWARRNYIITFAFVVFRLATGNIPGIRYLGTVPEVFTTFGWMSWVVPLLLGELLASARQMLAGHRLSPQPNRVDTTS